MTVECLRGISVSSALMSFEHEGFAFNHTPTSGYNQTGKISSRFAAGAETGNNLLPLG